MKKIIFFVVLSLFLFIPFSSVNAQEAGKVIGDFVTVRSKANSNASGLAKVIFGTKVTIIGEEGSFYKIIYDGLNTGYMAKEYILKDNEYKLNDSTYCATLKTQGFPDSYCPYLAYIHKLHPKWTFTALNTGLDFYKQVVDGEEGKNYINSTNDAYRVNAIAMEKGYYTANNQVNAYFLDPRNFILDKTIFMFENLNYVEMPENQKAVENVFGATSYLNTTTDNGVKYSFYYVDAGKTYNVSPIHLASSTKQEGGANADYGPITGTSTYTYKDLPLKGFYNYFNIGAYKDSYTSNPQVRGLAYAAGYVGGNGKTYGRPWDSRKKAIYGGAEFTGSAYINAGQNTVYLKKFQVNPNAKGSLYTNQYMTNLFAPYDEGRMSRNAHVQSNILEIPINFVIPVFNNMPVETLQPSLLSGNNLLGVINIDGEPLKGFDGDIKEYTLYYLDTKTSVVIDALSNSADAKITGTGKINLPDEKNKIVITVTAQNGDKREYVINIIRVKDTTTVDQVVQKLGVKNKGNYLFGMSAGTAVSTITQSVQKISPTATVKIVDANGTAKTTGTLSTNDKISIKTLTSAEKTFSIAINGDINGDGVVDIRDLLRCQKHLLGTLKLAGAEEVAADNNYDGSLNVIDLLRIQKFILGSITL